MKTVDKIRRKVWKLKDKCRDFFYIFVHSHLIRTLVTSQELDLEKREEYDKNLILISFRPTGGFGDYIISSKLLDEIMGLGPCRIDVYCEKMEFGFAVYGKRPGVNVLPYDTFEINMYRYDLSLVVEHFIHILRYNSRRVAKLSPVLADKIFELKRGYRNIYPDIDQQWFREATHFRRCSFLGVNRWTELRHGNVFELPDSWTAVYFEPHNLKQMDKLGLTGKNYITLNRGADSMGKTQMQTKVWPQSYYEKFVELFKKQYPDIAVVQVGSKMNAKILGADKYVLGEDFETLKWIIKGSMLHIDCEGGLTHLATQLNTMCIVLFGPTPMHFYSYPQNINLVSEQCSDCMGIHPNWAFVCWKGMAEPECMYSLKPELVFEKADAYLRSVKEDKLHHDVKLKAVDDDSVAAQIKALMKASPYSEMNEMLNGQYAALDKMLGKDGESLNIAVVNGGRDILAVYLENKGHTVTVFDPCFGYDGTKGNTIHCKYMYQCRKGNIDTRLGISYNIPYESNCFDAVIYFEQELPERLKEETKEELIRILKNNGMIIKFE